MNLILTLQRLSSECMFFVSVKSFQIKTYGIQIYTQWISVKGKNGISFTLSSCGEGLLVISDTAYEPNINAYEIEIGRNNNETVIRSGVLGEIKAQLATPGILPCNKTKSFWISWAEGLVKVGTGWDMLQAPLISWQDKNAFKVSSVGIATEGQETGSWEFPKLTGNNFMFSHL